MVAHIKVRITLVKFIKLLGVLDRLVGSKVLALACWTRVELLPGCNFGFLSPRNHVIGYVLEVEIWVRTHA